MSWTAPKTWSDGTVPNETDLNLHLRDNMLVLKVTRGDDGRISKLDGTTLADLSAANLTGLAKPAAGNSFQGVTRFADDSRLVAPVGADKWAGTSPRAGLWIEGNYLHHISQDGSTEWRYLGAYVSTPAGAVVGSVWIEGLFLHYVDASGDERRCTPGFTSHVDAAAVTGSAWVETYVHWIREGAGGSEVVGHYDLAHNDGVFHEDVAHVDEHSDLHFDTGHSDSHGDTHQDTHTDFHIDSETPPHQDFHQDEHTDTHVDAHSDVAHEDAPHSDFHTDTHTDHNDHGDAAHQDQPTVVP